MTHVRLVARATAQEPSAGLEDRFAGRWDPRRTFQPGVGVLVQAVADALEAAGWRDPATPDAAGGLVVGTDLHCFESGARFLRRVRSPRAGTIPPTDFLFALASSAAASVGVAVGLAEYQSTIAMHGRSGFEAVRHAADRIRLGRLPRAVAAALTLVGPAAAPVLGGPGPFTMAAAWCLEGSSVPGGVLVDPDAGDGEGKQTTQVLADVPEPYRHLAAPSLLAAGRWIERLGACTVLHSDPVLGGASSIAFVID